MEGSLENKFLEFLNAVGAPGQIVQRFKTASATLVSLDIATKIIKVRDSLSQRRFDSLKEIEPVINEIAPGLFSVLLAEFPHMLGWRLNDHPALLLPLRLETRYKDEQLWVRIYPDQVFVDSHEPKLTQTELDAGKRYQQALEELELTGTAIESNKRAAWRELARLLGPARAAWVIKVFREHDNPDQIPLRDEQQEGWFSAPKLMALPDRFEVIAFQEVTANRGEKRVAHVIGRPIYGDYNLLAGAASQSDHFFDADSKWMIDFDEALARGMAVRIAAEGPNSDLDLSKEITRLIVVGIRSASAEDGQTQLRELIDTHHYTEGMAFLKFATPTNNTENTRSAHSDSAEDIEGSYETEILGAPEPDTSVTEARTNAQRLGHALGLEAAELRNFENAGLATDAYTEELQTALWPATGDYFLRYLLPGVLQEQDLLKLARHFTKFVRASGPLPAIRVGEQPYGVLPVASVRLSSTIHPTGWQTSALDNAGSDDSLAFDTQLHSVLSKLHQKWLEWAVNPERVPRVNATDDPDEELLKILAMEPTSLAYRTRPFMDEKFVGWLLAALRDDVFAELAENNQIPDRFKNQPVDPDNPDGPKDHRAEMYLVEQWSEMWEAQRGEQINRWHELTEAPIDQLEKSPLLKFLGWWNDADLSLKLVSDTTASDPELPSEYLHSLCPQPSADDDTKTLLNELLRRSLKLAPQASFSQDEVCSAIGRLVEPEALKALLSNLPQQTTTEIERLFRQVLDLSTHRLDAWLTSLATKRLLAMRRAAPTGIVLGAYGWVENLKPDANQRQSDGYLHTPSQTQAKAAAVLYNAYLTHEYEVTSVPSVDPKKVSPFRIDLSSERVRRALRVLDGTRQGQSLGALLGYQFERALHERLLDQYIDEFRAAFPLVANKDATQIDSGAAMEALAARNVVDGLSLVRWQEDPQRKDIAPAPAEARAKIAELLSQHSSLMTEVIGLQNSLDAVSDLLTYEGVFQAAQGNYERAGAALDVLSAGAYPPNIESVTVPVTGKNLTHRVCLLLPPATKASQGARAKAEPRVAAWFANTVGNLSSIAAQFNFLKQRINLNTATEDELSQLPGIKKDTAKKLIKHRETHGSFKTLAQLADIWTKPNQEGPEEGDKDFAQLSLLQRWGKTSIDVNEAQTYQPINLNDASVDDLILLQGLNKESAEDIVLHRPYIRLSDLAAVKKIDAETIEHLRPWVLTGLVTLETLQIDAIDLLYAAAALPQSLDKLTLATESYIVDPLIYQSRRLNINQASVNTIAELPGLTRGLAEKIVKYRDRNGPFQSLEDLSKIWDDETDEHAKHKNIADTRNLQRWVLTGNGLHEEQFYQRININLDPIEELILLPEINPGRAKHIIDKRPFQNIDALSTVPGLKPDKIAKILPWATAATDKNTRLTIGAAPRQAADTELELRLKYFVRSDYRLGSEVEVDTNIWSARYATYSIGESIQLAQSIFNALASGKPLPTDCFSLPSGSAGSGYQAADLAELRLRVDAVMEELCRTVVALGGDPLLGVDGAPLCPVVPALGDPTQRLIQALLTASRYNITSAIPTGPYDPDLAARQTKVLIELNKRALAAKPLIESALANSKLNDAVAGLVDALKAILGQVLIVLPTFTVDQTEELAAAFSQKHFTNNDPQYRIQLWLQQATKAHAELEKIEEAMLTSSLWHQATRQAAKPALSLHVAQLPFSADNKWLALDDEERGAAINADIDANRHVLSVVAAVGGDRPLFDPPANTRFAGLLIEHWDELIPSDTVDTGVSFQYDAPNNQAPQCILLAVPSQRQEQATPWQIEELVEIVKDTMDLAKVRAVDPDAMAELPDDSPNFDEPSEGLGLVFPALMFPVDPAQPGWAAEEVTDSINGLVKVLEDFDPLCDTGEISIGTASGGAPPLLKFMGQWDIAGSNSYPIHQYARGITDPRLNAAKIRIEGLAAAVTTNLLIKDYWLAELPGGFSNLTVEGSLQASGSGDNAKLELIQNGNRYTLQGGAVLELGSLVSADIKVRLMGYSHIQNNITSLWVNQYDILEVEKVIPPTAVGKVEQTDDFQLHQTINGDVKIWFLDGDYDRDQMQSLLGEVIWVIGTIGNRGDGSDNITITNLNFGLLGPAEEILVGKYLVSGDDRILSITVDDNRFLDGSFDFGSVPNIQGGKIWVKGVPGQRGDANNPGPANIIVSRLGLLRVAKDIVNCRTKRMELASQHN